MAETPLKAAGAVSLLPLIFIFGFILCVIINLFLPAPIWRSIWIQLLGFLPLAGGILLFASASGRFRHHNTPLMPWTPSVKLVQDGPYRYTRNPIYLSFALMYLGGAFIFNSIYILIVLVLVLILFDRTQIPNEERYLQEKFGEEYTLYKSKVRRWI